MYADDTQLYMSCKPSDIYLAIAKIYEDLERIAAWSIDNCLLLNPVKTKYLIFGSRQQVACIRPTLRVMIMGKPLERVYDARNLGLHMDCELRYNKHIANCIKNCFYKLKVLYRRPYLRQELRIQLVKQFILSKINYMDTVYGS